MYAGHVAVVCDVTVDPCVRMQGLAYQKDGVVNWDPVDNTVLANEQVSVCLPKH